MACLNALFQIGPFWFGVVAAMPAVANAAHILVVPFFARFIAFGTVAGFWIAGAGAIAALYAFNDLGASPAQFTGFSLAATLRGRSASRFGAS